MRRSSSSRSRPGRVGADHAAGHRLRRRARGRCARTLAAPPRRRLSAVTCTTGTGASGEMRSTVPQMKWSSIRSPATSTRDAAERAPTAPPVGVRCIAAAPPPSSASAAGCPSIVRLPPRPTAPLDPLHHHRRRDPLHAQLPDRAARTVARRARHVAAQDELVPAPRPRARAGWWRRTAPPPACRPRRRCASARCRARSPPRRAP